MLQYHKNKCQERISVAHAQLMQLQLFTILLATDTLQKYMYV